MKSLGFILAVFTTLAHADNFKGTLYEKGSDRKKVLFYFDHEEESKNGVYKSMNNNFTDTEGHKALTETVAFDDKGELKSLTIDQMQTDEKGTLEIAGDKVSFGWTKDGKTKTAEEKLVPNLVVAATVVPYLRKHWDELLGGKTVDVRFAALDRRETVGFSYFKTEDKKLNGKDAMVIKMKASSFIIAAIVDPLFFTFEKESQRLVELVGRTAPKRKVGKEWKDLDAEVVYEYPSMTAVK